MPRRRPSHEWTDPDVCDPDDYPSGREDARADRRGTLYAFLICSGFWGGILLWLLLR